MNFRSNYSICRFGRIHYFSEDFNLQKKSSFWRGLSHENLSLVKGPASYFFWDTDFRAPHKCFLVKSNLQHLSFRSRVESAQFSEKIIGSGGWQKQAIELFGHLFSQPLNRDNKTNFTGRLGRLNEIKHVKCHSSIERMEGVKCHFLSCFWKVEETGNGYGPGACSTWKLHRQGQSKGQQPAETKTLSTSPLLDENCVHLSFFGSKLPSQVVPFLKVLCKV